MLFASTVWSVATFVGSIVFGVAVIFLSLRLRRTYADGIEGEDSYPQGIRGDDPDPTDVDEWKNGPH